MSKAKPGIAPLLDLSGDTLMPEYTEIDSGFILSFDNQKGATLKVSDFVDNPPDEFKDLSVTFKSGLLVRQNLDSEGKSFNWILGFVLDAALPDVSKLPLVGDKLPPDKSLTIENLRFLFVSQTFSEKQVAQLSQFVSVTGELQGGFSLSTNLHFGDQSYPLTFVLPSGSSSKKPSQPIKPAVSGGSIAPAQPQPTTPTSPPAGTAKWFKINKKLGPIAFNRAGIEYKDKYLWFLLDTTLSIADLALTLDGLGIGFDIFKALQAFKDPKVLFNAKFRLDGISLKYTGTGGIEISGAFLRERITVGDQEIEQYSGAAIVKTAALTLSAIGSYAEINGASSVFVYAFLSRPLGGPPFFFVTGLALGFGFNRDLRTPTAVEDVERFPLVQMVLNTDKPSRAGGGSSIQEQQDELTSVLRSLQSYIPPAPGKLFLAVGVKFTSFKLIDSFLLLIATFGDEFRLKLLGISKIVAPPSETGKPAIAEVTIGLIAEFIPNQGTLKVDGKILPGSYILDRKCVLSGGFAFYAWFKGPYKDDFVFTVGGYHPKFQVPAHYPRVDPLTLNWQVDPSLSVKGSAYFALTPSAIMAGGSLQAQLDKGDLKVQFDLKMDFLVAWQPLYYDISIALGIQVSYRTFLKTFRASLSADLHIWGPEFAGTATVKWSIISFKVEFGSKSRQLPPALSWDQFKQSFLPADNNVCTISPKAGLIRSIQEGTSERWVIEPKNFQLAIESAIPVTKHKGENKYKGKEITPVGISSMDIKSGTLDSNLDIKIERDGTPLALDQLLNPIYKNVPSALWGNQRTPSLNDRPIPNVLCGIEVSSLKPTFDKEIDNPSDQAGIEQGGTFSWQSGDKPDLKFSLAELNSLLGIEANTFYPDSTLFNEFLETPKEVAI